jgi:predicted nuclease with TOPRIM domain
LASIEETMDIKFNYMDVKECAELLEKVKEEIQKRKRVAELKQSNQETDVKPLQPNPKKTKESGSKPAS